MKTILKQQRGFTLISTMVGLLIGLMVAASALGTVSFMEASKRSAMGSNSALANGALGLFRMESEVKQAGLGLMGRQSFACPRLNLSYKDKILLDNAPLYPAQIQDGGAGPDSVSIGYLNTLTGAAPSRMLTPMSTSSSILKVSNIPDAQVGRLLLAQSSPTTGPCTVMEISGVTTSGFGSDINHAGGSYNSNNFGINVSYLENSKISVSSGIAWTTFRVNNNTLEELNNITGEISVIADNIVGLRAQYGVSNGTAGTIATWSAATGPYAKPSATDMLNVRALHIGLLARSPDRDPRCPATNAAPALWTGGPTFDLTNNPDWKCFKYRAFSVVVPLINVSMGAQ